MPGWPAARPLGVCFQIMFEAWTDESAPLFRLPNTRPLTFWGFGASISTKISISIASPALKSGHGLWTFASASFWSWPSNAEALRAGGRVSPVDAQARCGRVTPRVARCSRGAVRRRSMVWQAQRFSCFRCYVSNKCSTQRCLAAASCRVRHKCGQIS